MKSTGVAALLASVSWAAVAHAQAPAASLAQPAPSPAAAPTAISEVIVTANRREARLQDVPISVTALTGNTLQAAQIANPTELTQVIPNLNMVQQATQIIPVIRGIGSTSNNQGDEANVAIYIDGVYIADQTESFSDFPDVERVEVLRGPQGTLFGRNATGGLVQVITKDPRFSPEGNVEFRYGSFDDTTIRAWATAPLTDKLAFSVAGYAFGSKGWIHDLVNQGTANRSDGRMVRAKLLYQPSDNARLKFTISREAVSDPTNLARFPAGGDTVGRLINPSTIIAPGPWNTAVDAPLTNRRSATRADLQGHLEFTGFALEGTLSYSKSKTFFTSDIEVTPVPVAAAQGLNITKTYTGELRLLSTGTHRLDWIVGVYGFSNEGTGRTLVAAPTLSGTPLLDAQPDARARSAAVFGEGTYHVTDSLDLIVGGRLTYEKRLFSQIWFGAPTINDATIKYTKFTPRVSLKYDIAPRTHLFATFSQGFKSGGFNTVSNSPVPVNPETLTSYEVGVKSDPTPWLRINATVFDYDYKNLQVIARIGNTGLSTLQNAASAKDKGGEIEATLLPFDGLTLRGSIAYADSKYSSFPGATANIPRFVNGVPVGNTSVAVDASGKELVRSPKYTFNIAADYVHPTPWGNAGGSINVFHSDKLYWDAANIWAAKAYTMINGELFIEPKENLRISAWVKNLGNVAVAQELAPSGSDTAQIDFPPRHYGVSVSYKF
jgi:iron complex outermembrane receptor protein